MCNVQQQNSSRAVARSENPGGFVVLGGENHSDLNDQNSFHSTIDMPPGMPGVSKNPEGQTEDHFDELEC